MTSSNTSPKKKILVYAQHLSGVGHYVRSYEIARELAKEYDVYWVEGGRPVPHRICTALHVINLTPIQRDKHGDIVGVDADGDTEQIFDDRKTSLCKAIDKVRPDVFIIEYYPFSKWELGHELDPAIDRVRRYGGHVLCSLRDVVKQTRHENISQEKYVSRVLDKLHHGFDAITVHGDEQLTILEDHFPGCSDIHIPVHYTGMVSEKPGDCAEALESIREITSGRPYILVSVGGSRGGQQLIDAVISAWQDRQLAEGRMLVIFTALNEESSFVVRLKETMIGDSVKILSFSEDFLCWMQHADLSISQAGYNTAANILETGVKSIMIPSPVMSDQAYRADRLASLGLVEQLDTESLSPQSIALNILSTLAAEKPKSQFSLEGAATTRELVSSWLRSVSKNSIVRP